MELAQLLSPIGVNTMIHAAALWNEASNCTMHSQFI